MRQTKQKRYIMEAFQNYHGHPTAEELYAVLSPKHPRLSLATVYRNLNQFADKGMINRVIIPNGPTRFDSILDFHYHAICEECGELFDIDSPEIRAVDEAIHNIKAFNVSNYKIMLYGTCDLCKVKSQHLHENPSFN